MLGGAGIIANLVELSQVPGHFDAVGHSPRYQRLLFDTGAAGRGAQAIALATRVLGAEQLVFGSDYAPVPDIAPGIAQVLAAPISAAERELILRGNGQRLLASKGISLGS
ncbi:amidohydrolase family protein [Pseudomonas sp. HY2-MNA-CIBAN-0224]